MRQRQKGGDFVVSPRARAVESAPHPVREALQAKAAKSVLHVRTTEVAMPAPALGVADCLQERLSAEVAALRSGLCPSRQAP